MKPSHSITARTGRHVETPHASADMNVTPLIDVSPRVLIIFMATLPLTQRGVDINRRSKTKGSDHACRQPQVMLEYTNDRRLSINHSRRAPDLETRLRDIFETRKEKT